MLSKHIFSKTSYQRVLLHSALRSSPQFWNLKLLMEILQKLPVRQWPILQKKLKQIWPSNIPGYYALHMNLKYPSLREAFQFKVYCPYGNVDNGFVGLSVQNTQNCILFSTTEDTSELEEAFIKTKLIDWSERVRINFVPARNLTIWNRLEQAIRFTKCDVHVGTMFVMKSTTKPFTDIRLPENTYIGPVKEEYISQVVKAWSYKYSTSHLYFTALVANGLSYGLYTRAHKLIAWVFISEYNFLRHLFCEEGYRNKGYAECVMKLAVNDQLKKGNDVYAYVAKGNVKPLTFTKMGFKACDESISFSTQK